MYRHSSDTSFRTRTVRMACDSFTNRDYIYLYTDSADKIKYEAGNV